MRRIAILLLFLFLLPTAASAAYVPEEVIEENRDGRHLLIKTYTLPPQEDTAALEEAPFDLDGYHYTHAGTVQEAQSFQETKDHTEPYTLETSTNDLSAILAELPQSLEYAKDGWTGALALDHTTIKTEAAGYTTKYYTVTDTQYFTGLERNDPSNIPATAVKNGVTMTLTDITWSVGGAGVSGDTLLPVSYTAAATYTGTGSRKAATGYVTTASYTGDISTESIQAVKYTVTYLGTELPPEPEPEPEEPSAFPWGLLVCLAGLTAAGAGTACFLCLRPNTVIYAMNAKGVAYKKLGAQRMTVREPKLDLTRLREYPAGAASVEVKAGLAHKLAGRMVTIQLYDGTRTHLVERYEGDDNYWFAIKEEKEEGT